MSRILNFVREKAFVLILLGSMAAAIGTGVWAMNTVQQNLNQSNLLQEPTEDSFDGFLASELEGETIWDEPADIVTGEMNGEIAMEEQAAQEDVAESALVTEPAPSADGSNAQDIPLDSSTESAGASSSSDSSEALAVLEPQAATAKASFVLPVSGAVIQAYSGDELVYSETLGDWRTHNGVDYAADFGEEVIAPVAGEIISITTDGNWGGVVELLDADGTTWRFCGVESETLHVGDAITIGQVLGKIGIISAESAAAPHLHLEILCDGVYQDPSDYLK